MYETMLTLLAHLEWPFPYLLGVGLVLRLHSVRSRATSWVTPTASQSTRASVNRVASRGRPSVHRGRIEGHYSTLANFYSDALPVNDPPPFSYWAWDQSMVELCAKQ